MRSFNLKLCHCVQHPWKLTSRDFWSTRNKRKPLSQLKHVFLRKCSGVSQKWSMLELSNICHCVQHPWKLISRDFWSSIGTQESHFLCKNVFLRKCCGVSQKQWMLELSNLCHCVQHPWKLTSRDFWSSRNERKPLSKEKCVLRKCCRVFQKQWMLELSNHCHCVQYPWKLTSRDFWSSRNEQENHFLSKNMCWENATGVFQKQWMLDLSNHHHCVQHPWKLTSRDYWSSRNTQKPLSMLQHVLRKCNGVSQKQWMLELSNLCHCVQYPWNLTNRDFWSHIQYNQNKWQQHLPQLMAITPAIEQIETKWAITSALVA